MYRITIKFPRRNDILGTLKLTHEHSDPLEAILVAKREAESILGHPNFDVVKVVQV